MDGLYRVESERWVVGVVVENGRVTSGSAPLARKLFGGRTLEQVREMAAERGWTLEKLTLGDGPPEEPRPCHRADTVVDDGTGHA